MRLVIGEGILGNKARPSSGWTLVAPTEAFDLATEAFECIAQACSRNSNGKLAKGARISSECRGISSTRARALGAISGKTEEKHKMTHHDDDLKMIHHQDDPTITTR